MRITTDTFAYCAAELPRWNTISISGYHIREAGTTGRPGARLHPLKRHSLCRGRLDAGLEVDEFAPRLSFFFNAHNDLFQEVAKYRAARQDVGYHRAGPLRRDRREEPKLRFHTQTAGSSLTAQQAENNIVRTTVQALSAVIGGTQSLHTNAFDEALALPTERSARVALRTQQILALEGGLTGTADPLAGSYYVEALTDAVEEEAWEYIRRIDDLGGQRPAIEERYMQREIEDLRLPLPAGGREGDRHRRRQPLAAGGRRPRHGASHGRRIHPRAAVRTLAETQGEQGQRRRREGPRRPEAAAEGSEQPPVPDERGPGRPRDARRGLRHASRGLRRATGLLEGDVAEGSSSAQRHQATGSGFRMQARISGLANGSMGAYGGVLTLC